ncbi:MAG TPA: 4'-phosphopantetheinyl transferase superfamily protein [Lysobacter sp.]|nr:4'-phosphopantetheinyl transferase superfamily protein [Lysobacter sp.]
MTPSAVPPPNWTWQPLPRGAAAEPLARAWLAGALAAGADVLPIRRDLRGRPQLGAPFAAWDCNWSHSGGGLLVALGEGLQVGVDLEWRRPRPRSLALAQRYFTAGEAGWLAGLDPAAREHAFLRLWCAKEAVLKAHGHGLAFGLHRLEFADIQGRLHLHACDPALGPAEHWSLQEIAPAPGYLGALAWRRLPG